MSVTNPVPPSDAVADVRAYEPSMEEILASIRRIIADDQSIPRPRGDEEAAAPQEPTASVYVLHGETDAHANATSSSEADDVDPVEPPVDAPMKMQDKISAPQYPMPEGPIVESTPMPPVSTSDPVDDRAVEATPSTAEGLDGGDYFDPPQEYDRPEANSSAEPASLFSASTNKSVSSAFNVLAASRLADNSDELLGMARDMIRPLLRSWLDENLPSMVERLVRDEIERVARGGR